MKIYHYLISFILIVSFLNTYGQSHNDISGIYITKKHLQLRGMFKKHGIYMVSLNNNGKAYEVILSPGCFDDVHETNYSLYNDTIKIADLGIFVINGSNLVYTINKNSKFRKAKESEIKKIQDKYEHRLNMYYVTIKNGLINKL